MNCIGKLLVFKIEISTDANNAINYFKRNYFCVKLESLNSAIMNVKNRTVRLVNVRCDFSKDLW